MKHKLTLNDIIFNIANYAYFALFALMCIYPFYYVFIYSVSIPGEALGGVTLLPLGFTLANYEMLLKLQNIPNAFLVSAGRTVIGTIITIICSSFFAYLVTIPYMWYRKFIYRFAIFTMYFNAGIIPWYLTMKEIGLKDNFLVYIIPSAVSVFFVILIKTYIEQLPGSLSESAMIDGAGVIRIFAQIIFPLSKPIVATIAVFSAVAQWGSWFDNLLLVSDHKLQTLQLILYQYLNSSQILANMSALDLARGAAVNAVTPQSIQVTITMLTTLPIILVYPFLQRYFVKGIMIGAVKG
ncbi:carbohydrate ABC transporter permease [Paenibacillus sp. FSL H7-0714]|uniref:carbohydrate ABC transporter permease n=1 Tax=Paenibacillus sp. FSL H7-0714 TaxID=2954735 RepID=UPI0030FA798C